MRVLALGSGLIGHETNVRGVIEALGGDTEFRRLAPRFLFARAAPWGPADPADRAVFNGPAPDVLIAGGRITAPYVRAWRRKAPGVFTVFLQDPRWLRSAFDLIWLPAHDAYRAANVIATLTSPHPFSPARLGLARMNPDPRLAQLAKPCCAVVLGGRSNAQHFTSADVASLADAVSAIRAQGYSVMATPSRRTTPEMMTAVRAAAGDGFVWDGSGENPYGAMLALADAILVTGDSANMVGEAVATGAPAHVFEPTGGGSRKLGSMIDALVARGAARRWSGRVETFSYAPIDASAEIAAEIRKRFASTRSALKP